tara:strand:- start:762 stop:902 length:141 start_codon:yes stop_codon:yes gene_type:complete
MINRLYQQSERLLIEELTKMKVENKKKAIRIIISIKPEKNLSTTNL